MTEPAQAAGDSISADDIRRILDRMVVSDVFRNSPQLSAFLRYVVEAVLGGKTDRIKGYTIGVEVLRRDTKFDPQSDPIVRVEATRLRRAIERYQTSAGADDDIRIELPRGSYVPVFIRRSIEAGPQAGQRPVVPLPASSRLVWAVSLIALVALAAIGVVWGVVSLQRSGSIIGGVPPRAVALPGNGLPMLLVQKFDVIGTPGSRSIPANSLQDTLTGAFARFDLVNVTSDAVGTGRAEPRVDYRLIGSIEYDAQGAGRLRARLLDAGDASVLWSRALELGPPAADRKAVEDTVAREFAQTLVQPFGVIYTRGRAREASQPADERYHCILDTIESFRSFDTAQHESARTCLERLTAADSSFGLGSTYLASIYLREYTYGIGARAGDTPVLERALRAAQRGVELSPQGSRAHEMLFTVLFARRDVAAAFAAGDKAINLNPYDMRTLGAYGARRVAAGEIDRGLTLLRQAAGDGTVVPAYERFFQFLGLYLNGDSAGAAFQASQLTGDTFQLGLIARALAASAKSDGDAAKAALDRLVALNPAWRDDLRGTLGRFFVADSVVDRLVHDLTAAGLPDAR